MKIANVKGVSQSIKDKLSVEATLTKLNALRAMYPVAKNIYIMQKWDDSIEVVIDGTFSTDSYKAHLAFFESNEWTIISPEV